MGVQANILQGWQGFYLAKDKPSVKGICIQQEFEENIFYTCFSARRFYVVPIYHHLKVVY
jgi:hypothetical protein